MTEITTNYKSDPIAWMEDRNIEDFQYFREDFSGLKFEDKHFISGEFHECNFENTKFKKCSFAGISFIACNLDRTEFDGCELAFTGFDKEPMSRKIEIEDAPLMLE